MIGRLSTRHLSFVRSTRRQPPRSMPGHSGLVVPCSDGDRRLSRSTDGSRYPRLVPSGSRLGLRQHRLRGIQEGRRPPCSGCVVVYVVVSPLVASAQRQWRSLGARSMLDARSFMISTLRSQVGFAAAVAHARLRLSRLELIGGSGRTAAPPGAGRYAYSVPRAPSFRLPPSSRRGEALWEWVEAESGSLGVASSESAAGSGRLRASVLAAVKSAARFRPSRGRAGVSLGLDGCEVRLCDPCVRVCACVSRECKSHTDTHSHSHKHFTHQGGSRTGAV